MFTNSSWILLVDHYIPPILFVNTEQGAQLNSMGKASESAFRSFRAPAQRWTGPR